MAHFIKRNHGTESPSNYLFFAVQAIPKPIAGAKDSLRWTWHVGAAVTLRLEKGAVTRRTEHRLQSPSDLWQLVSDRIDPRRPLHVIGYGLAHTWRLAGGWEWLEGHNPASWRIVIANPPIMMRGRVNDCSVSVMDAYNWFPMDLDAIGDSLALPRHPGPPHHAPLADHHDCALRDCRIMETAFCELIRWWRVNDLGVLGKTLAGCAINAYRHRFMPRDILHHDNETCYMMERNCYYGGQLAIRRVGAIPGHVWELDVSSLYPAMMRQELYPYRLMRYVEKGTIGWLWSRKDDYALAANVWVRALHREYPVRRSERTIYPQGCYRTFLAGPELVDALERGDIVDVLQAACYQRADLFTGYVDFFWGARMNARARNKPHEELIAKLLLNSLYGKFAQRPMRWKAQEQILPPDRWCQWRMTDDVAGREREFRAIAGQVQELVCEGEPRETCPIIAACVTGHGREHMRRLRAIAGCDHWYYQDTDSLYVDDEGMASLLSAGQIGRNKLGLLKPVTSIECLYIHAPKWYECDGVTKHAGVKLGADPLPMGLIGQWQWDTIADGLRRHAEPAIYLTYQRGRNPRAAVDGSIDELGWVTPQVVIETWDDYAPDDERDPRRLAYLQWIESRERQCTGGAGGAGGASS